MPGRKSGQEGEGGKPVTKGEEKNLVPGEKGGVTCCKKE